MAKPSAGVSISSLCVVVILGMSKPFPAVVLTSILAEASMLPSPMSTPSAVPEPPNPAAPTVVLISFHADPS